MPDVLSEAISIIHKLSSKVDGFKTATIYLRNGLMIKADELDEPLIIKSLNECHCK